MYEARKVCNYLLARYDAQRLDLTNLRLNKLLFFIHAASLSTRNDGLIRNHFEGNSARLLGRSSMHSKSTEITG
jgi:uncharacterized phage-associated protein